MVTIYIYPAFQKSGITLISPEVQVQVQIHSRARVKRAATELPQGQIA